MIFKKPKYSDEMDALKTSIGFALSSTFVEDFLTIERINVGRVDEITCVFLNSTREDYYLEISRSQHRSLVERFSTFKKDKREQ